MDRLENIDHALKILLKETGEQIDIPRTLPLKQQLMRALMNVWQPSLPSSELLHAQDEELSRQRE